MKKIVYGISHRHEEIFSMYNTLKSMDTEPIRSWMDTFEFAHSYLDKKLVEWGVSHRDKNFYEAQINSFVDTIKRENPSVVFLVNCTLPWDIMASLRQHYRIVFWAVDGISGWEEAIKLKDYDVFVYDTASLSYMQSIGVKATYCPVGYNMAYRPDVSIAKNTDIVFVGSPYKKRCRILEEVARLASQRCWTLKVYGPFFESPYFWKPPLFRKKYPHLYPCIINTSLSPAQIAKIYQGAKIALNIHEERNKGVNPRTFDIMATGTLEVIDAREDYDIISPHEDVVIFTDTDELLKKLDYYLSHETERNKIAESGYRRVLDKRSMTECLKSMLR